MGVMIGGVFGYARSLAVARRSWSSSRLEKRVLRESPYPDDMPSAGDLVKIHYVGRLSDGTCFDNSRTRGKPFEFILGESEVIDAWEILISKMGLQEKAELTCPPQYAYGEDGVPPYIPPGETISYTVDLVDICRPLPPEKEPVVDVTQDVEEDERNFWEKEEEREQGQLGSFTWEASGSGKEIFIRVPLDDDVKAREIKVNVTSTALSCQIGSQKIVEGTLFAPVLTDDSFWDFEKKGKKVSLLITLGKMDASLKWDSLLQSGGAVPVPSDVEVVGAEEAKGAKSAKPA